MQYKRGDIVLAKNEFADGNIQSGTRPYLIISNNTNNEFSNVITVIPLTTKAKKPLPTHYTIELNGLQNTFLVEQITCISKDNILNSLDISLSNKDMQNIEKRIKVQLDLQTIVNVERGEIAGTEKDRRYKLFNDDKEKIWNDYRTGDYTYRALARKYKVSTATITTILHEFRGKYYGTLNTTTW